MGADRSRLPEVGPDPIFSLPAIVRHTLPSGLQVRTIEHASVPVVTLVLLVEGGASADPAGREGLAALTADLIDEGTGSLSAIDVADALARIGADLDVEVGADATLFTLTTITRFTSRGAALLSDLTTRPSLRDSDFTRIRQQRLDRLRQIGDIPPAVAERAFLRLLYGPHPYGHLAIGTEEALGDVTVADARSFHASTFRPERCALVLVGALPHDDLLRLAEDAFGTWTAPGAGHPPLSPMDVEPPAGSARLAIVPRDGAAQSELRIGHLAARRSTPDYAALLVMNAVLGGQFVSRINLKLREEKGFTYGARTGFDWRRGLAPFSLQASVHTAATAEAIGDALAELSDIRGTRPPSPEELSLARASLTRGYPRNFETAQQVARSVAQLALYDLPDTYFEEFVPRVNAITGDDVTRVAAQYLDPSRLVTLVVGDHATIRDSLETLDIGALQVLPATG